MKGEGERFYRVSLVRCSLVREGSLDSLGGPLGRSDEVAALVRPLVDDADRELFVVVVLNQKHRPIAVNVCAVGSLTAAIVHPREVFKPAILCAGAAIVVAHNHPSGDPAPSAEDTAMTRRLRECGELLGVRLLDSVILGDGGRVFSFADSGAW